MDFQKWLDTFIDEKQINRDRIFEVTTKDGTWNMIPLQAIVEFVAQVDPQVKAQIKATLVKIDFHNGDVYHFFNHMAEGMAQAYA
jgi:hypothetical protein